VVTTGEPVKLYDGVQRYLYRQIGDVDTLRDVAEADVLVDRYWAGIPWQYIRKRRELEEVLDEYEEMLRAQWAENLLLSFKAGLKLLPKRLEVRYSRPVYFRILEYLVHHPDIIRAYLDAERYAIERRKSEIYREIAEALGISPRTVRDAFTAFRRAGVLE
jgi:DNA-binding transcriptional ArsR family regulator